MTDTTTPDDVRLRRYAVLTLHRLLVKLRLLKAPA